MGVDMNEPRVLRDIERKAIMDAIAVLDRTGCQYKVIRADGSTYGNIVEAEPAKRRTIDKRQEEGRRHGELKDYITQFITTDTPVGQVVLVPLDKYILKTLRSSVCAHCSQMWGNGTYMTSSSEKGIEVMRTKSKDNDETERNL